MTLQDILRVKGTTVLSTSPAATLLEVARILCERRYGSLVVMDTPAGAKSPQLVGIITERDILRACAQRDGRLDDAIVRDYMTTDLITGTPANTVEYIMGVMTDNRIRHLPILEDQELVGLISIGDLVKAHHQQVAVENHYLKSYIHG